MLTQRSLVIVPLLFGLLFFTYCGNPKHKKAKSLLEARGYKLTEDGFYKAVDAKDLEVVLAFRDYFSYSKHPFDIINNGFLYACETGNLIIAKGIIDYSKVEIKGDPKSWKFPQALGLAFQSENEDLIRFLIDDMHAYFMEDKSLIQKYSPDRYIAGPYPKTLPLAVMHGNMEILEEMLDKNALIGLDSLNEYIRKSIRRDSLRNLEKTENNNEDDYSDEFLFDKQGAILKINRSIQKSICKDMDQALCNAADKGDLKMVKTLLKGAGEHYMSVCGEIVGDNFMTPLMHAASYDHVHYLEKYNTIEYLIEYFYRSYGSNKFIDRQNRKGETALLIATLSVLNDSSPPDNNTRVIKLLLDHGTNAYLKDKTDKMALDYAFERTDSPSSKGVIDLLNKWVKQNPESKFIKEDIIDEEEAREL